ncbi:MAG: iron ABC transporter permease [Flammeovirgaceae bacterium]|nr:iron ABC transporter permease [Flammeovirgaceae bacterium]
MTNHTSVKSTLILIPMVISLFLVDVSMGSVSIPFIDFIQIMLGKGTGVYHDIIWKFRMPKALTCALAGSALATGGLMMQTMFRNPLAGPDVLGLSSGSSLLVSILILANGTGIAIIQQFASHPWSVALAASLGASMVFMVIILIAQRVRDNTALLIIGLMIGAGTSSIVSVLQFTSQANDLQLFLIWTLGSVGSASWLEIQILSLVVFSGLAFSLVSIKPLNAFLLGDSYAKSIGVNVKRSRIIIVIGTSLLVGGVTAFCGPIAFVGLAVPHLVRLIVKTNNHKVLLFSVMAGGASLLLMCDIISQLPGSAKILPLNAVTSLVGAPVVIWLVIRQRKITRG